MKMDEENFVNEEELVEGSEEGDQVVEEEERQEDPKIVIALRVIRDMRNRLESLESLLEGRATLEEAEPFLGKSMDGDVELISAARNRVIDGVFDGEQMVGEDGRRYVVPQNYASKSKLVEGDLLRLTITDRGRFLFKQKGPIDRQRLVGNLVIDDATENWKVMANGSKYCVLPAAVSYFQGEEGDEVVILIPSNTPSRWAAVENIIKQEAYEEA